MMKLRVECRFLRRRKLFANISALKSLEEDEIENAIYSLQDFENLYLLNPNDSFKYTDLIEGGDYYKIIKVISKMPKEYYDKFFIIDSDLNFNSLKSKFVKKYRGDFLVWNLYFNGKPEVFYTKKDIKKHFICMIGRENKIRNNFNNFFTNNELDKKSYYKYHSNYMKLVNKNSDKNKNTDIIIDEWKWSFCNILFDTYYNFDKDPYYHFNEKIAKSLITKTPFISYGVPNQLKKLKELGFKTFDKWWDESYDEIEDDELRFYKMCNTIDMISKKSINEIKNIYLEMDDVLSYNFSLIKKYILEKDVFFANEVIILQQLTKKNKWIWEEPKNYLSLI